MKEVKCPLCDQEIKAFVCPEAEDLWKAGCFTCQWETTFTSTTKQKALQKAEEFISKFPPIMRVQIGERVKVEDYGEILFTIESKDIKNFKLYFKDIDIGFPDCCYAEDVSEWPWELEQKEKK